MSYYTFTPEQLEQHPTLAVHNTPVTSQQVRNFLGYAGIEIKFAKRDNSLNAQERLELATS